MIYRKDNTKEIVKITHYPASILFLLVEIFYFNIYLKYFNLSPLSYDNFFGTFSNLENENIFLFPILTLAHFVGIGLFAYYLILNESYSKYRNGEIRFHRTRDYDRTININDISEVKLYDGPGIEVTRYFIDVITKTGSFTLYSGDKIPTIKRYNALKKLLSNTSITFFDNIQSFSENSVVTGNILFEDDLIKIEDISFTINSVLLIEMFLLIIVIIWYLAIGLNSEESYLMILFFESFIITIINISILVILVFLLYTTLSKYVISLQVELQSEEEIDKEQFQISINGNLHQTKIVESNKLNKDIVYKLVNRKIFPKENQIIMKINQHEFTVSLNKFLGFKGSTQIPVKIIIFIKDAQIISKNISQ